MPPTSLVHSRATGPLPDLLGALIPAARLYQIDQVHLACLGGLWDRRVRLLALMQNTRDRAGIVSLMLTPATGRIALARAVPKLRIEIPPAAVLMARLDLPLRATHRPTQLRLLLKGSGVIPGGRTVRSRRRTPIHRRVRPPFGPMTPLWPRRPSLHNWLLHGRPCVRLSLPPLSARDALDPLHLDCAWEVGELWLVGEDHDPDQLAARIASAMAPADCLLIRPAERAGVLEPAP